MSDLLEVANDISTNNYKYNAVDILGYLLYIEALSGRRASTMSIAEFDEYCKYRNTLSFNDVCNYLNELDSNTFNRLYATCFAELDNWVLNFLSKELIGSEFNSEMFQKLCRWIRLFSPVASTSRNYDLVDYVSRLSSIMYSYAEERQGEYFTVENRKSLGYKVE